MTSTGAASLAENRVIRCCGEAPSKSCIRLPAL